MHSARCAISLLPGALQTLASTLHLANELPDLLKQCSSRLDAARIREEQTAIRHGERESPSRFPRSGMAGD
jgi:hypothetical protein